MSAGNTTNDGGGKRGGPNTDDPEKGGSTGDGANVIVCALCFGVGALLGALAKDLFSSYNINNNDNNNNNRGNTTKDRYIPQEILVEDEVISTGLNGRCSVCMDRRASVLFLPCNHLATCPNCVNEIERNGPRRCPMCNKNYTRVSSVFMT